MSTELQPPPISTATIQKGLCYAIFAYDAAVPSIAKAERHG
jgi:hypothetical protein